jgi:DNA polymerase III subunit chi
MTRCIFHDVGPGLRDRRLFDVVEEVYGQKQKAVVFAPGEERARDLDRLLWIMRQESFIPHMVVREPRIDDPLPVALVTTESNPIGATTLVADGHCSLEFALAFETVHEFVDRSSPQVHQACRDRYRAYQSRGASVHYARGDGPGQT